MVILVATCGVWLAGADEYPPHAPSAITDVRSSAETDRIGDLHHRTGFHHKENPLDVQERVARCEGRMTIGRSASWMAHTLLRTLRSKPRAAEVKGCAASTRLYYRRREFRHDQTCDRYPGPLHPSDPNRFVHTEGVTDEISALHQRSHNPGTQRVIVSCAAALLA